MVTVIDSIEIEELTIEEESAILEYEWDKQNGKLLTYSLEEVRRHLELDN